MPRISCKSKVFIPFFVLVHWLVTLQLLIHLHDTVSSDRTSETLQPTTDPPPRRVAIQTVSIDAEHFAIANHISYTSKWGLDYVLVNQKVDPTRHPKWQKIPATLELFEKHDYDFVMWMDSDAIFANCSKSIEPFLQQMEQEGTSWLFSGDTLIVNSGQMIFKNTAAARDILKGIDSLWFANWDNQTHRLQDNAAVAAYIGGARQPIQEEVEEAYKRADRCWATGNTTFCRQVQEGDRKVLHEVGGVTPELIQQISMVPHLTMNVYIRDILRVNDSNWVVEMNDTNDMFIFHCAGQPNKTQVLEQFYNLTNRDPNSTVCTL